MTTTVRPEAAPRPEHCARCGALVVSWRLGRGRHVFEHPNHRYSNTCGHDLDWYGTIRSPKGAA